MGATASLNPEVFSAAKVEYESKKNEGLTDEQLFNHMKQFIETKSLETATLAEVAVSHQVQAQSAQNEVTDTTISTEESITASNPTKT